MTLWLCVQLLLLINNCINVSEGTIVISPSPRAAVCNVGNELEVTCNTNRSFLAWNVIYNNSGEKISRTLSSTIRFPERVEINSTVFTFSRMSELGRTDLESKLVINPVSQRLNGTKIICKEIGESAMIVNTTVYIIGNTSDYLNSPRVSVSSEIFGTEDIIVALNMQADNLFENISVSSSSPGIDITAVNTLSARFTMPYNTPTNVSITAYLCGIHNSTVIGLNYAKCESPLTSDGSSITVSGYSDLGMALEGANITFKCSSGFILDGPTKARCASTGQWIPDPREVKCLAKCGHPKPPSDGYVLPYSSTVEGARVIFACRNITYEQALEPEYSAQCSSNGKWEPNPSELCILMTSNKDDPTFNVLTMIATASSVCFFLVVLSLVLSFIVGFACGHCNKRFNGRAKDDLLKSCDRPFRLAMEYPIVEAVYECPDNVKHQNHEPKLEENVAYAPLQQFRQS